MSTEKIVLDIISSGNAARYVAGIRVNGNRYWDHCGEIRVWTAAGKLASNYKRETGDNLKGARQVLRRLKKYIKPLMPYESEYWLSVGSCLVTYSTKVVTHDLVLFGIKANQLNDCYRQPVDDLGWQRDGDNWVAGKLWVDDDPKFYASSEWYGSHIPCLLAAWTDIGDMMYR